MKKPALFLILLFSLLPAASCTKKAVYKTEVLFAMGTVVEITLPLTDEQHFSALNLYIHELSDRITADCKKISDHKDWVEISRVTYDLIERGRHYTAISEGKFDPAVATVTRLYGFPEGEYKVPSTEERQAAKHLLRASRVELEEEDGRYFAQGNGLAVELGAYAKGWIVDQASTYLIENGINHFIINAGGDLYASGTKFTDTKWRLGIKDPAGQVPYLSVVRLQDKALATSGIYERFFIAEDGSRISHLFDAATGETVTRYQSISVIADTAETADALSTIYFLAEPEKLPILCRMHHTPVFVVELDGTKRTYCGWDGYE